MVAHTFKPSTPEAEAGRSLTQIVLQTEFQDSQGYTEKLYLEKNKAKTNKQKRCVCRDQVVVFLLM